MKIPASMVRTAILLGCPLLLAAAGGAVKVGKARFGLDRWTYIQADNERVPTSKKKGSFGIGFAYVNGDGKADIASGAHFYRNPGGDMSKAPWPRVDLPNSPATGNPVDAGLLFNVKGAGPARDIMAEDLPNIVWLHTDDPQGGKWTARVVAQMPPPRHGNGRMIKLAKITPGAKRPDILLTGGGGTYLLQVPEQPEAGNWPITKITHTDADEQKAIGLGDIDGDGHVDLVLAVGIRLPDIEWWGNPGDGSANWKKHPLGKTINMAKMIEMADVNGDGRLDVVATDSEHVDSGLFWFEAPADPVKGKWIRHDVAKGYNGLDSMSVEDMNADGRPDIVIGETKDKLRLVIYENVEGEKSWKEHLISEGKESHKGANAVDLDGDGDLDLVSIAYFGFKELHVWRNDNGR
ncbi:MAG: VCBS repeat-containing protein [Opitutaceae bacterium]|nr:VCBS repeat-containing protein [Opitutaceae bacterium]